MKKVKIIPISIFYIIYFAFNYLNSLFLLGGVFNPNISEYTSFGSFILSSLGDLGVLCLLFFVSKLIFKKDKGRVIFLSISSFILLIIILFLEIFSNMFTTFFSYNQISSFENPSQMSLILGYISYVLKMFLHLNIIMPIVMFLVILVSAFLTKTNENKRNIKNTYGVGVSIIGMLIPMLVTSLCVKDTANEISMNGVYGCSHVGAYNYYLYSLYDLSYKEISLDNDKKMLIQEHINNNRITSEDISSVDASNKNLIIIQMEAINDFVIDLEIEGELIAPCLKELAYSSYYNNRFYSVAGMGNTSDCEFASICGLYPNGNDLSIFEIEGNNYPSIAKEFKKKGYTCFSIHGNDGEFYNRNTQHKELFGFDRHIDKKELLRRNKSLEVIKDWISDEALLNESINIYKEMNKPFFSYNILVTSHGPYSKDSHIERSNYKTLTSLANDYISYVKYVDKVIGNYINKLKEEGLYGESIIIIYGDHTSSLLKSDVESMVNKKYKDDVLFRLEMQNVPFIILGNDIPKYIDNKVRSNIDIYATLNDIFDFNIDYAFGKSVFIDTKTFTYNPRSLDIIRDDYIIESNSNRVYYLNDNVTLDKKTIKEEINRFNEYKYINDLLVHSSFYR